MFGIDTFSWYKIIHLHSNGWNVLLEEILNITSIFITYEVQKELNYRFPGHEEIFTLVTILPKLDEQFKTFTLKDFDEADASLLSFSHKEGFIIITEDHPMLNEGITDKKNIIQLADFFAQLYIDNFLTRREFHKLIRSLKKMKNISKRKEKDLIKLLKNAY
ncbi:MAG: hypothetical protein HeimC3_32590 [Candidatus Heimdallarchaeota archaeon LC_3]|nr:MAG: hypothetical protein HeimC3_32590 [Candidatus Heimdallarchaeota archaeon LC_3]